jgi:hypothetical protein
MALPEGLPMNRRTDAGAGPGPAAPGHRGRRALTSARITLLGPALLAAVVGGCGSDEGGCQNDMQCGMTQACVNRGCVTRLAPGESAIWSIEVVPPAPSPHAARELPSFTFSSIPATVPVDRKVMLAGSISRPGSDSSPTATSVNVTAAVPSKVPGRRDLVFEAQAVNHGGSTAYEFNLALPERLVGQMARLTVAPTAPLNRTVCPWWLELPLTAMSAVTLPVAEDTIDLRGMMDRTDPGLTMPLEYEARIFVGDTLSSNLARTDVTGRFDVEVQKSWALRTDVTTRVEIAAADSTLPVPILSLPLPAAGGDLGVLRMPVYPTPVPLVVSVIDEMGVKPAAGATVRMSTLIPGAVGGEARYTRSAQTGADGKATILVVPAVAGQPLQYMVKVVPPADSESGPRCLPSYEVAAAAADGTRTGPPIMLPRRVVLDGRVLRAEGRPASGLRVRATRAGDTYNEECGGQLASPPAETITDSDGRYRMRLDPGEYRIDYEPEGVSTLPWAVEELVSIVASVGREVALPATVMVEGQVVTGEGANLPGATVRAFALGGEGRAEVRGSAVSDSNGRFRMVLPKPAPATPP